MRAGAGLMRFLEWLAATTSRNQFRQAPLVRNVQSGMHELKERTMPDEGGLRAERRTALRYKAEDGSQSLAVVHNEHHHPATLHDISAEGVGVILGRPIEPGAIIRVEIRSQARCCWYLKKARVVHAQPLTAGSWLAGLEFLMKLDERSVPALFAEYALVPAGVSPPCFAPALVAR
jgi:hypothetical protein